MTPALALALLLAAGDAPPPPARTPSLEELVEVRAQSDEETDPAAFVTVIELDGAAAAGADLADVLRRVPGAHVRDYGGLGSYATVSLRGSTAEQVTVLLDGVPQNRALGGAVDLSSIPVTLVDRVRVYRGFGPAGLAAGGPGGVIDLRTHAADTTGVRVDLLAGELGTRRLAASAATRTLRVDAELLRGDGDYTFLDTGGTFPFNTADDTLRRRRNNDIDHATTRVRHALDLGSRDRIDTSLTAMRRERGVPWVDSLPTTTVRETERRRMFSAGWSRRFEGQSVDRLDVRADAFRERRRLRDPDGNFGVARDRTARLRGGGVSSVLRLHEMAGHRLTARVDVRRERVAVGDALQPDVDRGGSRRRTLAAAVEGAVGVGAWVLAPSVRWERRRDRLRAAASSPAPTATVDRDGWSGKLGAARAFGPRTSLRGSIGYAFRSPSLLELFGDSGALRGNSALRAERGPAVELGLVHETRRRPLHAWRVELVGFARRTRDLIHLRQQSQGVAVAVNLARAEVLGVESAVAWNRGRTLGVEATLTHQRAVDRSGGPFDGSRLAFRPSWLARAGARWTPGPWRLSWDVSHTGRNPTDAFDIPALRLPARTIHDAAIGREWPGGARVSLDVRNVFDRRTVDVARYPLPDRVLLLHVGWGGDRS